MKRAAVLIAGPTASGKSALALGLARQLDGVIINADSMQLYADLRVLTARPTGEEEAQAPHRLYGVRDGALPCSAAQWRDLALAEIEAAWRAGRLPILVGGTTLYLETLLEGIAEVPDIPDPVRQAVRALPTAAVRAALVAEDPAMATRLGPADRQRQARALEVVRATGRSLADWQAAPTGGLASRPDAGPLLRIRLTPADRAALYRRCDDRLVAMVAQGALDEVACLLARGLPADAPVMKAVGVPELAAHLRGDVSLAAALERAQQMTRNYAKRQLTWLRNRMAGWELIDEMEKNIIDDKIVTLLRKYGLTTQS